MEDNRLDMDAIRERVARWLGENQQPFKSPKMAWGDIETTGLDLESDMMIEIGIVITDENGFVVPNGVYESVIYQPSPIDWDSLPPVVSNMHKRSNLTIDLESSDETVHSSGMVEDEIVHFLKGHFGPDMAALRLPLSGSTISFDKAWIARRMPKVAALFGHRHIDVSTLMEIRKAKGLPLQYEDADHSWEPMQAHRVIPDIIDSIESYRYYCEKGLN